MIEFQLILLQQNRGSIAPPIVPAMETQTGITGVNSATPLPTNQNKILNPISHPGIPYLNQIMIQLYLNKRSRKRTSHQNN